LFKNIAAGGGASSGSVGGLWTTADATQPLTRSLVDSLIAKKAYINFHTAANPGGEVRGQVDFEGDIATSVQSRENSIPVRFSLGQNYPNPFNPETIIPFTVADRSVVQLKVFDILGREVRVLVNETLAPGAYTAKFGSADIASGVYFYGLSSSSAVGQMRKMIIVK